MMPASEAPGLPASLRAFPGSALELSDKGIVLESNGRLETLVGSDIIGCQFGELLDSTSQVKWALLRTRATFVSNRSSRNSPEALSRAEAESAVRVRDEVLSIVAHDLRSPLDRIVACAPMLHESLSDESRDKLVAVIERTAKSMNRLLSSTDAFSKRSPTCSATPCV